MGKMADFTMEDLGLFITLMATACGGLLAVVFKSRCKVIRCCGASIEREIIHTPDEISVDTQSAPSAPATDETNDLPNGVSPSP